MREVESEVCGDGLPQTQGHRDPSFTVAQPTFSPWLPLPCVISVVLSNVHQISTIEHAHIHKPLCRQLLGMRREEEAATEHSNYHLHVDGRKKGSVFDANAITGMLEGK